MNVEVPKILPGEPWAAVGARWSPVGTEDGVALKPIIRCDCGRWSGIGLHHVHADGTVTASFFHDSHAHPEIGYVGGGCGWHVFIKLLDYTYGDFPPSAS